VPANSIQKTAAFDREATFADPAAKDWASLTTNGAVFNCFDLDYSKIVRQKIPNKNLKQRAGATRAGILGLRNCDFSFGTYWIGNTANAAAGVQATRVAQDELLLNALGGEHRGYAAGVASGTAAAPVVTTGQGANLLPYGFSFFYDTSAGIGHVRQYASIATDTLTVAPGHTLPFTPAAADVAHAVVAHYPNWDAIDDHSDADHTSLLFYFKGRHSEESVEARGCSLSVEFGAIEQGAPAELAFGGMANTFAANGLTQAALIQTPAGAPGRVVGSGVSTLCYLSTADALLATQTFWGQVQITVGIKKDPVTGPNGSEGQHGHGITEDSYDATTVEITVPFDDSWIAEFHAETLKHLLVQIGTSPTNTVFAYFPNLTYASEPEKVDVGGRRGLKLTFTALERDVAQGALSAAAYHRARAKFVMGRVG
jgi:hypothetical protein